MKLFNPKCLHINRVIKGITIIINDKTSDIFCFNELIINKGEKQQANVDHDINTRLKTLLLSLIAIVTTNVLTKKFVSIGIKKLYRLLKNEDI